MKLTDVARRAGVSAATVSRVLSHPEVVAEATRAAVLLALDETGYRVNHAARNLRKQRTGSVVALVPNLGNPFFARILEGMGHELARAGYDLLVSDTLHDDGRRTALRHFLDPSRCDGVILLDGLVSLDEIAEPGGQPLITACEWLEAEAVPRVMLDNAAGGRLGVAHLLAHGHRHIGIIGGPAENILHRTRLAGAQEAAGGTRITLFEGDFTMQSGQQAARDWLALAPAARPSGVFAFSDEMACAFMATLQRAGVMVPRDVSVIGFDDIELLSCLAPALTTIRQPKREIGRLAARTLLHRIAGEPVPPATTLAPILMERESVGPAPCAGSQA